MVLIIMIILLVPFLSVAHLGRFAASWRSLNCLSASWSIGISSDGYDLFVLSEFLLATLILEPGFVSCFGLSTSMLFSFSIV